MRSLEIPGPIAFPYQFLSVGLLCYTVLDCLLVVWACVCVCVGGGGGNNEPIFRVILEYYILTCYSFDLICFFFHITLVYLPTYSVIFFSCFLGGKEGEGVFFMVSCRLYWRNYLRFINVPSAVRGNGKEGGGGGKYFKFMYPSHSDLNEMLSFAVSMYLLGHLLKSILEQNTAFPDYCFILSMPCCCRFVVDLVFIWMVLSVLLMPHSCSTF